MIWKHVGVAGWSAVSGAWQGVVETYYKIQLSEELIITPDLQLVVGDDVGGENRLHFLAGIKLGLPF
ncbi:carbohydrate porin [Desulfopila sp. IMCC35008]|uniref:carbohydrate porin n=1 Tax=Desulfopila sp. IMCC35008 TaxID=2653858 RepID=UPI0013D3606F|nr:carbohydrate porin [Desulfopila sp. IMCC35008]